MKIFIKKIILFLFFTVIFYPICISFGGMFFKGNLVKNLNYRIGSIGHLNSRIKDLESYRNVDILFLGSSHAYRGFDTRIFEADGIKTFNLGSSAQTPIQTEVLVKRYLEYLNPKLIVIEVYPLAFEIDGVESAMDIIANDTNDIESIIMALKLNHIKVYNTLLYGIFRDIFSLNDDFVESKNKGNDTYIPGGFVEKKLQYYESQDQTYSIKTWNFSHSQMEVFENILVLLDERNIDVILVQAPIPNELYNAYSNYPEIDKYFSSLGNYYNFNRLIELENHYFYDYTHLNQPGVEVFNGVLIEILQDNDALKYHIP
jgi:hypothetical protein